MILKGEFLREGAIVNREEIPPRLRKARFVELVERGESPPLPVKRDRSELA